MLDNKEIMGQKITQIYKEISKNLYEIESDACYELLTDEINYRAFYNLKECFEDVHKLLDKWWVKELVALSKDTEVKEDEEY